MCTSFHSRISTFPIRTAWTTVSPGPACWGTAVSVDVGNTESDWSALEKELVWCNHRGHFLSMG